MRPRAVPALVALIILSACSPCIGRLDVGVIDLGTQQECFVNAWGLPHRQYTAASDEFVSAGWTSMGGGFFKGKRMLDVWVYETPKAELVFSGRRLVGYKTGLTREELQRDYQGPPAGKWRGDLPRP